MISFLLLSSSFFNFCFYIFAVGFVISLVLEQFVKQTDNETNLFIVQVNRRYCWRQAWVTNLFWFLCNIGIWLLLRNAQTPSDTFWNGI